MTFIPPTLEKHSYSCPHCKSIAPQDKFFFNAQDDLGHSLSIQSMYLKLYGTDGDDIEDYEHHLSSIFNNNGVIYQDEVNNVMRNSKVLSICTQCFGFGFWIYSELDDSYQMVYPVTQPVMEPEEDMPDNIKELYKEASACFPHSKKASSALLRTAIELYLKDYLLLSEGTLYKMIGSLKEDARIPRDLYKGLDVLRYYGNEGAHPGSINLNEEEDIVLFLFKLINEIVNVTITRDKEIDELYSALPQGYLDSIGKRDSTN